MPTNEEIERMDQIMNDIERQLMFGTNSTTETTSGTYNYPGLMSQISAASSTTWTTFTGDTIRHYLSNLEISTWVHTQPDYYRYTIGNDGSVTIYPGSGGDIPGTSLGAYGGIWDTPTSQVNYKNYSVQELKYGKQTKFILTTKSGIKKEKIVLPNKVESERQNLSKGRIMGYKQHWENV